MKNYLLLLVLTFATASSAREESAVEIAKRVIADPSTAYTPRPAMPMGFVPKPSPRKEEEVQLERATEKARKEIHSYMLGEDVPEKTRIAYAITVLATKRIPEPFGLPTTAMLGGSVDVAKNEQFLHDGLVLAARLEELENAEQAAPKP